MSSDSIRLYANCLFPPQLTALLLPSNSLRELSSEVGRLLRCQWLDVSHNQLELLPVGVWDIPELVQASDIAQQTNMEFLRSWRRSWSAANQTPSIYSYSYQHNALLHASRRSVSRRGVTSIKDSVLRADVERPRLRLRFANKVHLAVGFVAFKRLLMML